MLQAFFLLSSSVVAHVVLIGAEDASRLHGATTLRAQDTLDHDAPAHVESPAIVADPVVIGDFVDAVATLVHRNIACPAEDDQVLVLVVTVVANGALSVFLHDKATLVGAQRVVALDVEAIRATVRVICPLCELLQDPLVI